ncbi:MAG: C/D box methylation guide ribonucleoprotein complex aNOP56 subunit [Halobacteria archaeon]
MKSYIVNSVIGIFALEESGEITKKSIFRLDSDELPKKLLEIQSGQLIADLKSMLKSLKRKGFRVFVFENEALAKSVKEELKLKVEVEKSSKVIQEFKEKIPDYAIELGMAKDIDEFKRLLHDITLKMARMAVGKAIARRDLYAIQAIRCIDILDKTLNLLSTHAREWYGLHFPELDRLIEKHETYVRLVSSLGRRNKFTVKALKKEGIPGEKMEKIYEASNSSVGAEIGDEDMAQLQKFCEHTLKLFKLREELEDYVKTMVREVAPNMNELVGPLISARLISTVGGLENLAKLPASTLQVLGAEKALFRALRTGAKPPKHGIIFQHPSIHQAPRWQRGKIARALASKLSIAARMDAFKGEFIGDKLKSDFEDKVSEIKSKYGSPPVMVEHGKRKSRTS